MVVKVKLSKCDNYLFISKQIVPVLIEIVHPNTFIVKQVSHYGPAI